MIDDYKYNWHADDGKYNPYTQRIRDQHFQILDLLITLDELEFQVTSLTIERDVLQERLDIAHQILKRAKP